ncbi:MAG: octaprenyl diphosphate synthase [Thiotrichales bacterium]
MSDASPLNLVAAEMRAVNQLIIQRLSSDVVLINQVGHYIVNSGGKRLRPMLVLLAGGACGVRGQRAHLVAAIIEFIHTATLLHDDVVDESKLRRGRETANALFGNEASVLVGDFLYSRAFELMVEVGSMRVMEILAHTTNTIAEGEVMQLLNVHDPDTTEARYLEVIHSKTAKLFEAATQLGAGLGERPAAEEQALAAYGLHLGTAFQLIDDVLDYEADQGKLGKQIGDDLAEGKPTLPLIHALRVGTPMQAATIRRAIEEGGRDHIEPVLEIVQETGAMDYTRHVAEREARAARACLDKLPPSAYRDVLAVLADQAVRRDY